MRKKHLIIASLVLSLISVIGNLGVFSLPDLKINRQSDITRSEVISSPLIVNDIVFITIKDSIRCAGEMNGILEVEAISSGMTLDLALDDYDIVWKDNNEQTIGSNAAILDNVGAGSYSVKVTKSIGSPVSDFDAEATIELIEPEELTLVFEKCLSANQKIKAIVSGGTLNSNYNYYWEDSNGNSPGTEFYLTTPVIGTPYFITVTETTNGNDTLCTIEASVTLTEDDQISIDTIVQPISCMGGNDGSITIVPSGGSGIYHVEWNNANQDTTFSIDSLSFGSYAVTVTDNKSCSTVEVFTLDDSDTVLKITNFSEVETVTFENNQSQEINYLTNITPTGLGMEWKILDSDNVDTTSFISSGSGNSLNFTFELIEKRDQGFVKISVFPISDFCPGDTIIETTIIINPSITSLAIPEIISPNGDNVNDEWELDLQNNLENYSVIVYSRSGYKVYSSDPVSENYWDGKGCPDGTYYYILKNKTTDETLRGAVSIIRGNTN